MPRFYCCASTRFLWCILSVCYLPHFFFWNQQMNRWMSLHRVFVFLNGLLSSGMSFRGMLPSLCLPFYQFYPVLVLREATLCFEQRCAWCWFLLFMILLVVLYQVLSLVLLFRIILGRSLWKLQWSLSHWWFGGFSWWYVLWWNL